MFCCCCILVPDSLHCNTDAQRRFVWLPAGRCDLYILLQPAVNTFSPVLSRHQTFMGCYGGQTHVVHQWRLNIFITVEYRCFFFYIKLVNLSLLIWLQALSSYWLWLLPSWFGTHPLIIFICLVSCYKKWFGVTRGAAILWQFKENKLPTAMINCFSHFSSRELKCLQVSAY